MKNHLLVLLMLAGSSIKAQVTFQSNPYDINSNNHYFYCPVIIDNQPKYVPQIPLDAMYEALTYKQQLYGQRLAVMNGKANICIKIVQALTTNYETYRDSFNKNAAIVWKWDITDDAVYYSALDWLAKFQNSAWETFEAEQAANHNAIQTR